MKTRQRGLRAVAGARINCGAAGQEMHEWRWRTRARSVADAHREDPIATSGLWLGNNGLGTGCCEDGMGQSYTLLQWVLGIRTAATRGFEVEWGGRLVVDTIASEAVSSGEQGSLSQRTENLLWARRRMVT